MSPATDPEKNAITSFSKDINKEKKLYSRQKSPVGLARYVVRLDLIL